MMFNQIFFNKRKLLTKNYRRSQKKNKIPAEIINQTAFKLDEPQIKVLPLIKSLKNKIFKMITKKFEFEITPFDEIPD